MSDNPPPPKTVNALVRGAHEHVSDLTVKIASGRKFDSMNSGRGKSRAFAYGVEIGDICLNIDEYSGSAVNRWVKSYTLIRSDVVLLVYNVSDPASLKSLQKTIFFQYGRYVTSAKLVLVGLKMMDPPNSEVKKEVEKLKQKPFIEFQLEVSVSKESEVDELMSRVLERVVRGFQYPKRPCLPQQCTPSFPDYQMNAESTRGICLIINNERFYSEHEDRVGTDHDVASLKQLFLDFGYSVRVETDKTAQEMKDILQKTSQDGVKRDHDSFVCCILTHGHWDSLMGVDGEEMNVQDVYTPFSSEVCSQLKDKPRLFLFQACRGSQASPHPAAESDGVQQVQRDAWVDVQAPCPAQPDVLSAYATTLFSSAYRTDQGTPFVQEVVRLLREHQGRLHLEDIFTQVAASMKGKNFGGVRQIPCKYSTLTKHWYMPLRTPAA